MPKTKKEFIALLAKRMKTDEETAKLWIDSYNETLFEIFKTGEGVTIDGFGGFYLERRSSGTAFKFNPGQRLKAILGWSSTYKEKLK
jgi:nucleoid DNA-binding protein